MSRPFNYAPAATRIYTLTHEADLSALGDAITMRLDHLSAMLGGLMAETGIAHRRRSEEAQDNYAWACASMADELVALFEQYLELQ